MSDRKQPPAKVVILGAGISGLACAHKIFKNARAEGIDVDLNILEATHRVGGKIATDRSNGVLTEGGPDSFLASKPEALELARELGLEKDLIPAEAKFSRVWIYSRKKLRALPKGTGLLPARIFPFLFSRLLSLKGRLRTLAEPWAPLKVGEEDESISAFVARRFGREFLDKIADPILSGIYAAPSDQISLLSSFPSLREMEKRGGLLRSLPRNGKTAASFMTLKDGISSLSNALMNELPSKILRRESPALHLREERGGWEVSTLREKFQADAVIAAIPANVLAPLLRDLSPELSSILSEIIFAGSAVINLIYRRDSISHPLHGYGFVSVRGEGSKITAATFSSTKFPHRAQFGKVLIRVFIGSSSSETGWEAQDESALARMAHEELAPILKIKGAPLEVRVSKWIEAHPIYSVGHGLRMKRIESCLKDHPGFFLAGSSYQGVGIPDCIRSGYLAAGQTLNFLKQRRHSSGPSSRASLTETPSC